MGMVGIAAAGCHGADTLTPQAARCGATPRLLVSAASYWEADAGSGTASVVGMAVGGSDIYFSVVVDSTPPVPIRPGALMHVSTDSGAATQLVGGYEFQAPVVTPTSVIVGVLDASSYAGGILSVPRNGGAATPLLTFNDELFLPPVTDGASLYFIDNAGVQSIPLAAGAAAASPTQLSSEQPLGGLGVFGQRLLLLSQAGAIEEISIGSRAAGAETVLDVGTGDWVRQSLITCGVNACWLANGAVQEIDPIGGGVSTPASLSGGLVMNPMFFAFDGTNFFVLGTSTSTASGDMAIERIPPGGAPVTVANLPSSQFSLSGFAVDDACVYFTTPAGIYSLSSSAEGVVVP
jgi:hypothetical protein